MHLPATAGRVSRRPKSATSAFFKRPSPVVETAVDALLDRLIRQFASPYDFLRELVQNAMDAGSDRVEVTLATHPCEASDEVVFELRIVDTGAGMDASILEEEFTRLFASSKTDDRTMAGGYGIGFVSVFAWEPEAVLVQTGRAGEAWELEFDRDRKFVLTPVDMPFEGTTITLLRRGPRHEHTGIAEAIRDSLWRWCRFCPLEISFEDLEADEPPELIHDKPSPTTASLAITIAEGDHQIHVALAVPPSTVLLRRGLILAEGTPSSLLPEITAAEPKSVGHLQIWVDSPELKTTLARDKVVDGPGMARVRKQILAAIAELRTRLLNELEQTAAHISHPRFSHLHAHLRVELEGAASPAWQHEQKFGQRQLLRGVPRVDPGQTSEPRFRTWSLDELKASLPLPTAIYAEPKLYTQKSQNPSDDAAVLAMAQELGFALIAAEFTDLPWLRVLLQSAGLRLQSLHQGLWRVPIAPPADPRLAALVAAVQAGLQHAGFPGIRLVLGHYGPQTEHRPTLVGLEFGRSESHALVVHSETLATLRRRGSAPITLWLDDEDAMLMAAAKLLATSPKTATLALACTIATSISGKPPESEKIAEALAPYLPPPASD